MQHSSITTRKFKRILALAETGTPSPDFMDDRVKSAWRFGRVEGYHLGTKSERNRPANGSKDLRCPRCYGKGIIWSEGGDVGCIGCQWHGKAGGAQ